MRKEELLSFRMSPVANYSASELEPARCPQQAWWDFSPPENLTSSMSALQTTDGLIAASAGSLRRGSNPTAKRWILRIGVLTRRLVRERIAGSSEGCMVEQTLDTENVRSGRTPCRERKDDWTIPRTDDS